MNLAAKKAHLEAAGGRGEHMPIDFPLEDFQGGHCAN